MTTDDEYTELIERIVAAENSHDADKVAELMVEDYQSETPNHPERNFTGREQVRKNWRAVFESTPDLDAELVRSAVDGDTLWTEWHMTGTQTDGTELNMRGVGIWGVEDGLLQWGRIYMEPVEKTTDVTWQEFYSVDESAETDP